MATKTYFSKAEFRCRCQRPECDALPEVKQLLLDRLNVLRYRVGRPLIVTSGLRCKFWNTVKGGAVDSEHLTGEAADIAAGNDDQRYRLLRANFAELTPLFTRFGLNTSFIHFGVGVKPTHNPNRVWLYA